MVRKKKTPTYSEELTKLVALFKEKYGEGVEVVIPNQVMTERDDYTDSFSSGGNTYMTKLRINKKTHQFEYYYQDGWFYGWMFDTKNDSFACNALRQLVSEENDNIYSDFYQQAIVDSITKRAEDIKYNHNLNDSTQDYTYASIVEAYENGCKQQHNITKFRALNNFCCSRCENPCDVKDCKEAKEFLKYFE